MADDATNTTYPVTKQAFPAIAASDLEDAPGLEHDVMHDRLHATVNALQDLLGVVGEEPPATDVLARLVALETGGGGGSAFSITLPISDAAHDILAADAGKYHRFTNEGAKTCSFRPDATEALPANGEWHLRNAATGDLTLTPGSGVTLNPPADGSLVVPEGGTVTVKRVATDTFDVLGYTQAP